MRRTRFRGVVAVLAAGTLLASAACGGSGFDDDEGGPTSRAARRPCRSSSDPPVTPRPRPCRTPRRRGPPSSGNTATVTPGAGPRPAARPGAAPAAPRPTCSTSTPAGSPTTRASARSSRTATRSPTRTTSTRACASVHLRRASSTARPRTSRRSRCRSTPTCGRRPGSPRPTCPTTWDQLTVGGPEAQGGEGHSRWSSATPATGSARSWCRPAAGSSARTASRPPPTPRRTSPALEYVQTLLKRRAARPTRRSVDAGWGGEAFGKGKAAMTIEGNWIKGAMQNDFPDVKYTVHPLPAGPAGQGTLSFTQCWGIAAKSKYKDAGDRRSSRR